MGERGSGGQNLSTTPFRFTRSHKRESGFKSQLTCSRDFVLLAVLARAGTDKTAGKVTNFIDSLLSKPCSGMGAPVSVPMSVSGYFNISEYTAIKNVRFKG